jgi:8-oxo-dGTP diphosphatase
VLAVDVAVMAILNSQLHVLLIPIHLPPEIVHAKGLPGGLVRPRETAEDAVMRHLADKAAFKDYYCEQLSTFSGIERDPRGRVVSVAYLALVPAPVAAVHPLPEGTTWTAVDQIGKLAYDHNNIVTAGHARLRTKLHGTTIARRLLAPRFTLSELQSVYECVLGRALDKRNFRKKLIGSGIVTPTGTKVQPALGRPGQLYRFAGADVELISILSGA